MKSSFSFYFEVVVFILLLLFFVNMRLQTETVTINHAAASQRYENIVCKIKIINTATGSIRFTQWMSKEDAFAILSYVKKYDSGIFLYKTKCKRGGEEETPKIMVMLASAS